MALAASASALMSRPAVRQAICPSTSMLLLCDMQERFRSVIHQFDAVSSTCSFMVQACDALDIPTVVTEQYPKVRLRNYPKVRFAPWLHWLLPYLTFFCQMFSLTHHTAFCMFLSMFKYVLFFLSERWATRENKVFQAHCAGDTFHL